jgi:hypothetical protein
MDMAFLKINSIKILIHLLIVSVLTTTIFYMATAVGAVLYFDLFFTLIFFNLLFVGGNLLLCYLENQCLKKHISRLIAKNIIDDKINWVYKLTSINPFYKKLYAETIYNKKAYYFKVDISSNDVNFFYFLLRQ